MEELQLTLTPARVDQRNFGVMLSNWRVGQVINALVVDRMPSGNVLLNAGGREFVTPLDLPVPVSYTHLRALPGRGHTNADRRQQS